MLSYQYRKSHCGDKTVVRSSNLHNGISYTGKTTSLYWIGPWLLKKVILVMLVLGIFMKLNYLCQMNVLVLKLWNCKSFIGHFYLPSMFDQFVQKVLCSLFWKIMNLWFHNTLHVVSSHSLCMNVIACQITGNLNVWMTALSRTKASLQQQKHQSSLLFAFCRRGFFSQGACDEKCCHVTKSSYIKTQLYYTDGLHLFLSSCYVSYTLQLW